MGRESIDRVLKYFYDNQDIWVYSVKDIDDNNNVLYRYYSLFLNEKKPVIIDLENPIETLQKVGITPQVVQEGTKDYLIFMAYKDIAERNIMNRIKK